MNISLSTYQSISFSHSLSHNLSLTLSRSRSLALALALTYHSLTHSLTRARTLSHPLSLALTHSLTRSLCLPGQVLSLTLSLSLSLSLTRSLSLSLSPWTACSLSPSLSLPLTHSLTLSLSPWTACDTLSLSPSLSHSLSLTRLLPGQRAATVRAARARGSVVQASTWSKLSGKTGAKNWGRVKAVAQQAGCTPQQAPPRTEREGRSSVLLVLYILYIRAECTAWSLMEAKGPPQQVVLC